MTATHNISTEQALRVNNKAAAREPFANLPTLLPIVHVERPKKEREPFRVTAQGIPGTVAVWQNDAPEFAKAYAEASTNANGARIVPVLLSGTQGEPRTIEGVTLPGYYNLNAKPMNTTTANPFA